MTQSTALYGVDNDRPMEDPKNVYITPPDLVDRIRNDVFDGVIDLDPATESTNPVGAITFYTVEDDGLSQAWRGRIFINPPYGRAASKFAFRALVERHFKDTKIVMLLACRPSSKWQQKVLRQADDVLFLGKRLNFLDKSGNQRGSAPFDSVLVSFNCTLEGLSDLGVRMQAA